MRKELDEALCKKYPKIFRDRYRGMEFTCMCWGFECGDGWFDLIDVLCGTIQRHIDSRRRYRADTLLFNRALRRAERGDLQCLMNCYAGTTPARDKDKYERQLAWAEQRTTATIKDIDSKWRKVPERIEQVVAVQVKEKFGGLRFYIDGGDDEINAMIDVMCEMSYRICEDTGNPGKVRSGAWIRTLSDVRAAELGYSQ